MTWPFVAESRFGSAPDNTAESLYAEQNISLPWTVDPISSWVDYRCWLECHLDAGLALHKPLPSSSSPYDTLASCGLQDANLDALKPATGGVNLNPGVRTRDVIQRMATPTYTFVLRGYALRVGYQVPIPGLKTVGGVPAVPAAIQRGYNVIVANLAGGIPLWYAPWELHYYVTGLPTKPTTAPVPYNPALHIRPDAELPNAVHLPATWSDQRHAVRQPLEGSPIPRP